MAEHPNTKNAETVDDIIVIHNETQEKWTEKADVWSAQLEQALEDIQTIKADNKMSLEKASKDIKKIKKDIREFDVGHCVRDSSFLELDRDVQQLSSSVITLEEKYTAGSQKLTEILVNQAKMMEHLSLRSEIDNQRNGKVDKIGCKEDESGRKIARIEQQLEDQNKIITAIEGLNERLIRLEEKQNNLSSLFFTAIDKKDTKWERRKALILKIIVITVSVTAVLVTVLSEWGIL
ncbi:MAG: hypothetical protein Q8M92_03840 [Candidatus Subteraquimicrobiales bacterium]|nr:hypothetical protein [Candidatus Subteraquimicrobiales bacterium]